MADPSHSQASTAINAAESYSQRANADFEAQLALRTASKEGAFFLPHLQSGMRLPLRPGGFEAWAVRPDAFYVETFCESLGWVSD